MRVKCPICHKKVMWEKNPYRPFCSERCKLVDLGQWASEQYKVSGEKELCETDQTEQQEEESSNNGKKTSR